jgi:hypothetical protein
MPSATTEDGALESYGPGTYVDTAFTPLPEECQRLLRVFAAQTPGFTKSQALLDGVRFVGNDLPCIPGPIKSQAVTAVLHAMIGIVGLEISHLRGITKDTTTIIKHRPYRLIPCNAWASENRWRIRTRCSQTTNRATMGP